MTTLHGRSYAFLAAVLMAAASCSGPHAVPTASIAGGAPALQAPRIDTTPVLPTLTQQVLIGTTVDPINGDQAPRGITVAPTTFGLTAGQLLVCNSANSANAAGQGSTVEVLDPVAGSTPAQFSTGTTLRGCDALTMTGGNALWSAASTARAVAQHDQTGAPVWQKTGKPFAAPFGAIYALGSGLYPAEIVFVSDAGTGAIYRINVAEPPNYSITAIVTGFAVNKSANPVAVAARGPSGLQYDRKTDTLYVVDGVNNTLVSLRHASEILLKDAIVVQPGGKTFKGPSAKWARLVYGGKQFKAPVASALLSNGNLIVANTTGGNRLVELTPTGKILAQKIVEPAPAGAILGLLATGTTDANTILYFTESNTNTLQALEP